MAAIAAALGKPLMPWQRHVVDVAMELDHDGSLYYGEVDLVVGRQEGKTELKMAVAVHRMTKVARRLGPQTATFTMQTRAKARKRLERDYCQRLRGCPGFTEVTNPKGRPRKPTEWMIRLNNGSEHIQFGRASYLQIDAPSRTGGHGDTLDDGFIDEAFAHEGDDVEQSMTPAMITREWTQLWVVSAAGDEKSKYLWRKIIAGRAACGSGEHGRTAYFEWSAPDEMDPADPETWRVACPALGYTITEAKLAQEWGKAVRGGQEGIDRFRRSFLCQWPVEPVLDDDMGGWVIPEPHWRACLSANSGPVGPMAFALDVSPSRSSSTIAVAAESGLGGVHVEVTSDEDGLYDNRPGTDWVVERAVQLHKRWGGPVAVAKGSPAESLVPDLEKAGLTTEGDGPSLVLVSTSDHAQACGELYDAAAEHTLRHLGQPELDAAVAGAAQKDHGDAWLWSRRKSSCDITPLVAATLAAWALKTRRPGPAREPMFAIT